MSSIPDANLRMRTLYRRWMEDWENRLCFRTNNRVVRPFEWGTELVAYWPFRGSHRNGHDPEAWLRVLNRQAIENSDDFFGYTRLPISVSKATCCGLRPLRNAFSQKTIPFRRSGTPRRITRARPWSSCPIGIPVFNSMARFAGH